MRDLFVGWAVLLFLASVLCAVLATANVGNQGMSIAMGLTSAGFSISGGLVLVAAAVSKGDK